MLHIISLHGHLRWDDSYMLKDEGFSCTIECCVGYVFYGCLSLLINWPPIMHVQTWTAKQQLKLNSMLVSPEQEGTGLSYCPSGRHVSMGFPIRLEPFLQENCTTEHASPRFPPMTLLMPLNGAGNISQVVLSTKSNTDYIDCEGVIHSLKAIDIPGTQGENSTISNWSEVWLHCKWVVWQDGSQFSIHWNSTKLFIRSTEGDTQGSLGSS